MALPERWHTTLVGFVFLAVDLGARLAQGRRARAPRGPRARRPRHPRHARPGRRSRARPPSPCAWAFGTDGRHRRPVLLRLARVVAAPHAAPALLARGEAARTPRTRCSASSSSSRCPRRPSTAATSSRASTTRGPPRWRILGARVGPGLARHRRDLRRSVTSPRSTSPTRLAVFFPALVFGWLRARTGGIGRVDDVPHALQRLLAGAGAGVRAVLGFAAPARRRPPFSCPRPRLSCPRPRLSCPRPRLSCPRPRLSCPHPRRRSRQSRALPRRSGGGQRARRTERS